MIVDNRLIGPICSLLHLLPAVFLEGRAHPAGSHSLSSAIIADPLPRSLLLPLQTRLGCSSTSSGSNVSVIGRRKAYLVHIFDFGVLVLSRRLFSDSPHHDPAESQPNPG